MQYPNWPLGVACPGSPEDQDMQHLSRGPKRFKTNPTDPGKAISAPGLSVACPGPQDMQHPMAS